MDFDINELRKQLGITDIVDAVKGINDRESEKAAREAKAAQEAQEQARIKALIDDATGDQKTRLEAALETITSLEKKLNDNAELFATTVEKMQTSIQEKGAEIQQLLAAREGRSFYPNAVAKAMTDSMDVVREVENVVLLSYITGKSVFETNYGKAHEKAVNASSSAKVSSESYETIFSQNILRDIQKQLVVANLFEELPMTSKLLTMMIEPESGVASWVDASTYGTDATTGNEITMQPTEVTFKTFKLAAKIYMTDETEEDAIVALLPIIRRHLVEAHAKAIETAFMTSTGATGTPKGLIQLATDDSRVKATAAKGDGSVKVAALMIHALRRNLGRHGMDLSKLALIVSMDAYYDLLEDPEFQDVSQVAAADAIKLNGQVGRIYGMPVLVSEWFPAKAASAPYCMIVYRDNFVVPRQRTITVEKERQAGKQRDAYYATQRLNLQRLITGKGIVVGTYAA